MYIDPLSLHKGSVQTLEIFLLPDHFDPNYLPQCVKPVFTTLSKKLHSWSHGGLHFRLKTRAVEPSDLREATHRKTFQLTYNQAVDNLNYSRYLQRLR